MDKGLKKLAIELREELRKAADELDKHTKNVNIARVAGGSTAVIGGAMTILGFAMAPLTLGTSAVVTAMLAGGAVLGGAGGLTARGASMAKGFIEINKLQPLIRKWSFFIMKLKKELYEKQPDIIKEVENELQRTKENTEKTANISISILKEAMRKVAGRRTARQAAAKGAAWEEAAEPIFLNATLISLNFKDIIDGSIQLYNKRGSNAGDYLREMAWCLDEILWDD